MGAGDWAAIVMASVTLLTAFCGAVWFIVKHQVSGAVDKVNVSTAVETLSKDFDAHKSDDVAAFARVDKQMSDLNVNLNRLDAKVDVLVIRSSQPGQ